MDFSVIHKKCLLSNPDIFQTFEMKGLNKIWIWALLDLACGIEYGDMKKAMEARISEKKRLNPFRILEMKLQAKPKSI